MKQMRQYVCISHLNVTAASTGTESAYATDLGSYIHLRCHIVYIWGYSAPPTQEHDLPLWRSCCRLSFPLRDCHYALVGGALLL